LRNKNKSSDKQYTTQRNAENAGSNDRQKMLSLFHQTEKEYELRNELVKELVEWTVSDDSLPNLQKNVYPPLEYH
jgi:ABC-type phosphate transport system substrate-binding protein